VNPTIVTGLRGRQTHEVTPERTTGHAARSVLATPSMIGLIEWACFAVTADLVDKGETTVGTHVCVSHEAAVVVGESVDIGVELTSIEGRKLTFAVEVTGPRGRVSTGTHQRAVIRLPEAPAS
jgi:fluoroacetyl-CoA thioesterase